MDNTGKNPTIDNGFGSGKSKKYCGYYCYQDDPTKYKDGCIINGSYNAAQQDGTIQVVTYSVKCYR